MYKVKDVIHPITKAWNVGALSYEVAKEDLDRIYVMPISVYHTEMELHQAQRPEFVSFSLQMFEQVWKMIWNLSIPPKIRHF